MRSPQRALGALLATGLLIAPLAACSDDDGTSASTTTAPNTTATPTSTSTSTSDGEPVDGTPLPVGLVELLDMYCLWPEGPKPTTVEEVLGEPGERASGPAPESAIPQIPEAERVPGLEILHAGALAGTCADDPAEGRTGLIIGVLGGPTDRLEITAGLTRAVPDGELQQVAVPSLGAPTGLEQTGGWAEHLSLGDGGIVARVGPEGEALEGLASAERRNEVFAYVVGLDEGDEPFTWWFQTAQRTGPAPTDAIEWRLATGSTG